MPEEGSLSPAERAPSDAPLAELELAPKPPVSSAIPPTLLLGYVDLAIRGTLEYERYGNVYLSPWWEMAEVPEGIRAWKRAVLERRPLRGAEHWGHLYLIVSDAPVPAGRLSLFHRPTSSNPIPERPFEARLSLREGRQLAQLVSRPTGEGRAESLAGFAREVEIRFRRQMD